MTHFSLFGVTIMEQITLGQIASAVALLAGLVTGGGIIIKQIKKALDDTLKDKFNGVDLRLDSIEKQMKNTELLTMKTFLMQEMRAIEHGEKLDEYERIFFLDEYEQYIAMGQNSYIRSKYESLRERGLL